MLELSADRREISPRGYFWNSSKIDIRRWKIHSQVLPCVKTHDSWRHARTRA